MPQARPIPPTRLPPSTEPGEAPVRLEPPPIFAYLDAVARHGSIRKAADALHIAASALNRRILDLEDQVGLPLFERLPRGVRATATGELFLAYVRKSLKDLHVLEAQIGGLKGLVRGSVSIAVAESVTGRMLPNAVAQYQAAHPNIAFSVVVDGPQKLAELLMRDRADLILTHELTDNADLDVLASVNQPMCALVAPEHPLATRKSLRLRDCVGYPIAMPNNTLAARKMLDLALEHASVHFEPSLVSNSIETTKIFARTRGGVCFSFRIGDQCDASGMITIPLSDPEFAEAKLHLACRRGRVLPVAAASFAEELADQIVDL